MRAFAVLTCASVIERAYTQSPFYQSNLPYAEEFRRELPPLDFAAYRGVGRTALGEIAEHLPGWQTGGVAATDSEPAAREVLAGILGPEDLMKYSRAYVPSVEHAQRIFSALAVPEDHEIVELCTGSELPGDLLGFDLGYCDGESYSILCDTAIWPVWHPPTVEAMPAVIEFASALNENLLFSTRDQAQAFLQWYACEDWAEKPPEDFSIIAVGSVAEPTGD